MIMYVKRGLALFLSVAFTITARGAVSIQTNNDESDLIFKYSGPDARTVGLAGEFSNWSELPMTRDATGDWLRTVHLKPGYYGYKLIVNGEWVLDPVNSARKVVNDIEDSAVSVGGVLPVPTPSVATPVPTVSEITVPTSFLYADANAKTVQLAGDFNNWLDATDGKVTGHDDWLFQNGGAGNWTLTVPLKTGKHAFKYVVDGGARWETNPHLPVDADGNSIIEVRASAPVQVSQSSAGTSFTYTNPAAKGVFVAGEFNQWNTTANPMLRSEQGVWTVTIPLKPGKYLYKLVVDGAWKTDPLCPDGPDDGHGGKNSIKVVSP
jgi:1,4-alpha-glucan branching enzyme